MHDPNRLIIESFDSKCSRVEPIHDIWHKLEKTGHFKAYRWKLPDIKIPDFRIQNNDIQFEVELVYLSIGIFSFNLSVSLSKNKNFHYCSTSLRHLISLGSPYALPIYNISDYLPAIQWELDIKKWEPEAKKFFKLSEIIEYFFKEHLDFFVARNLPFSIFGNSKSCLYFDTDEYRYSITQINKIYEGETLINLESFVTHPCYPAFRLPLREVCGIDDWILRPISDHKINLATIKYYKEELIYVYSYSAVLCLFKQPNWVQEQAFLTIISASIICNLLQATTEQLSLRSLQIFNRESISEDINTAIYIQNLSLVTRLFSWLFKDKIISSNVLHYEEINDLLDIIRIGSLMSFPPLSLLFKETLKEMNFLVLENHTKEVILDLQNELDRQKVKIETLRSRKNGFILNFLATAASIISFDALFNILKKSSFNLMKSPDEKLLVLGISSIVIFVILSVPFKSIRKDIHTIFLFGCFFCKKFFKYIFRMKR